MQTATRRAIGIGTALKLLNPDGEFEIRWFDAEGFPHSNGSLPVNYYNAYCTFNPIRHTTEPATDADVLRRRWFYIDVDPERPAGIMATAEEVNAARQLAWQVITFLEFMGWPRPLVSFTGNGIGLYYSIDLPNDADSLALVKRLLRGLATRFDTDQAKIDPSVCNAARITRIPGTWNRKGPDTRERPHRQCRILSTATGQVDRDSLQFMADWLSPPVPVPVPTRGRATRGLTPGTDYDVNGPSFAEILTGWTLVSGEPDDGAWRRPGKTEGISATTRCRGANGEPIFHVFSSNAPPFVAGGNYGKFRTLALIRTGGDASAAAKKLYADGWGERM